MGSATDYKFAGWQALDPSAIEGKMVWQEFEPKPWEETDVDIKITHAGMCGTDLHYLRNGFGNSPYPLTVGHEIVGIATKVGSKAGGGIKLGDRVGVGAQGDACLNRFDNKCADCAQGEENYCDRLVWTYGNKHYNGGYAQGGYATYHRAASHFVVRIPEGIDSADVAPMMCGGVTMYAPLKAAGVKPGMSVGIVGVGGLGHYGVLFAKAMGARVVGISRRESKRKEVLDVGADDYIATEDDKGWDKTHARSLDLIICTVSSSKLPLQEYFSLLKKNGTFIVVGLPDDGNFQIAPFAVVASRVKFTGSCIGSPEDIRDMLNLVTEKNLRGLVQKRSMKDANQAVVDLEDGKARYRYVLVNEDA